MRIVTSAQQYPIFGSEINCPHCLQSIPALFLTDTYLCSRHGAFEVHGNGKDLIHLQSDRKWRRWNNEWYRQHTHPDGIRFEIHESIDRLYTQGYRAVKVIIAHRYMDLVKPYLEVSPVNSNLQRLYGLSVEFNQTAHGNNDDQQQQQQGDRWEIINFEIEKELGTPKGYPYFRSF